MLSNKVVGGGLAHLTNTVYHYNLSPYGIIIHVHTRIYMCIWICMVFVSDSQVLSIVQSPYSGDFSSAFLPLVQNQEITAPLINSDMTDPVSLFLGVWLCMHTVKPMHIKHVYS